MKSSQTFVYPSFQNLLCPLCRRGSTSTASTTAHLAMVTAAGEIIQAASHSEPPSANHI